MNQEKELKKEKDARDARKSCSCNNERRMAKGSAQRRNCVNAAGNERRRDGLSSQSL